MLIRVHRAKENPLMPPGEHRAAEQTQPQSRRTGCRGPRTRGARPGLSRLVPLTGKGRLGSHCRGDKAKLRLTAFTKRPCDGPTPLFEACPSVSRSAHIWARREESRVLAPLAAVGHSNRAWEPSALPHPRPPHDPKSLLHHHSPATSRLAREAACSLQESSLCKY